jgi:rhomboid protease GluP
VREVIRRSRLTEAVFGLTAAVSVAGLASPDLREALQRKSGELGDGEPWRLVTSLLVHDSWGALLSNLVALAVVGAAVEATASRGRWVGLYLVGGVTGQLAGLRWQPSGAGNSVAWCGLLGGLAVMALRDPESEVPLLTPGLVVGFAVVLGLAAAATGSPIAGAAMVVGCWAVGSTVAIAIGLLIGTNIHGPALLAGAAAGLGLRRR